MNKINVLYQKLMEMVFISLFIVSSLFGQSGNSTFQTVDQPLTHYFGPKDYKSMPENWSVIQDKLGRMYFGNGSNVLEFDGNTWRIIKVPRSQLVRALRSDPEGRIYLSAGNDVGFLEPDSIGQMRYVSLNAIMGDQYNDKGEIWDVAVNSKGIFFKTKDKIYRWSDNLLTKWDSVHAYRLYKLDDKIYSRNQGVGLMMIEGDSLKLMPDGEYFDSTGVFNMLPFELDENNHVVKTLITTSFEGLFIYNGKKFSPFPTEVDNYLMNSQIYNACILSDGNIALSTQRGGVVLLNRGGELLRIIDENTGLNNNGVYDVYHDNQGGLWMAADKGIFRTEFPSPFSIIPENGSISNPVNAVIRYENKTYAADNFGISVLSATNSKFEIIEGSDKPAYEFLDTGSGLLAATNQGCLLITGGNAIEPITFGSNNEIVLSKYYPGRIYLCDTEGIKIIEYNSAGDYNVFSTGITEEVLYTLIEESDTSVWIRSNLGEIINVLGDLKNLPTGSTENLRLERFGEETGFQVDTWEIYDINGKILFTTNKGIFTYSRISKKFTRDSTLGNVLSDSTTQIKLVTSDAGNDLWVLAIINDEYQLGKAVYQNDGSYKWVPNPVFQRLDLPQIVNIYSDIDHATGEEKIWISADDQLILFNPEIIYNYKAAFSVILRRVIANNELLISGGTSHYTNTKEEVVLPFSNNDIRFEYSATSFDKPENTLYRYYLEGVDDDWSNWTTETKKDYTNLSGGNFKFRVMAKNIYGVISNEDIFSFSVLPPFYLTFWAYGVYFLIFIGGIFVTDRVMRRRIIRKERNNAKLREAELIQKQAEELETVDKLVRVINNAEDLDTLFNSLLEQTVSFIPQAEKAALLLLDHTDNQFHVAFTIGYEVSNLANIRFLPEELIQRYTENSEEIEKGIYIISETDKLSGDEKLVGLNKAKSMLVMAVEWDNNLEAFVVFDSFADRYAFNPSTARILHRFREHAISAISKAQSLKVLQEKNEKILHTQEQLVTQQKLASLGALTAGIAHEIKNPLNFVNNFAELSSELLAELEEIINARGNQHETNAADIEELISNLKMNLSKINNHGQRANSIIKGMLLHSRGNSAEKTMTDLNDLLEQYVNLAYHGLRAQNKDFNITIEKEYDAAIGKIMLVPQDISRVFLNIINNACYAVNEKKLKGEPDFTPTLKISTKNFKDRIEIRIYDNGNGISPSIKNKLFTPFFTTKPAGEGTGLGLSLSYDIIVKLHGGEISCDSEEGRYTEFIIRLPKN